MDILQSVGTGFSVALEPTNLLFCLIGVLIGTLVGVLPGIGPVATISLLLPVTLHTSPVSALIMLAGIYYGAMYGGSTASILVNMPGEAASVITCIDGYKMARKGLGGPALGISAFGSFIAGTTGIIGLMFIAPLLARTALKFGPPEYFSLAILGLTLLTFLGTGPMWKSLLMASFGIFLGCIGMDTLVGCTRFTFDVIELSDGIGIVPVAMGLFGVSEVLVNVEKIFDRSVFDEKIKNIFPTLKDWARSIGPILRGTVIGFFLGVLPGGGAVIAAFASYAVEKKVSKSPERFGEGAIEGVAGPESANNAASAGAFIPLLTLGIPANPVMAVLLGAMMVYGVPPSPLLIKEHPDVFWGVITSMYTGNVMLLLLNLPLIWIWVKIIQIPYPILFPLILLLCLIGSYSMNNSITEVMIMISFGAIGYILKKYKYNAAPLVMALVLGPMVETALRRSLLMSSGNPLIFITRPITAVLILLSLGLLLFPLFPSLKKKHALIPKEDGAD